MCESGIVGITLPICSESGTAGTISAHLLTPVLREVQGEVASLQLCTWHLLQSKAPQASFPKTIWWERCKTLHSKGIYKHVLDASQFHRLYDDKDFLQGSGYTGALEAKKYVYHGSYSTLVLLWNCVESKTHIHACNIQKLIFWVRLYLIWTSCQPAQLSPIFTFILHLIHPEIIVNNHAQTFLHIYNIINYPGLVLFLGDHKLHYIQI